MKYSGISDKQFNFPLFGPTDSSFLAIWIEMLSFFLIWIQQVFIIPDSDLISPIWISDSFYFARFGSDSVLFFLIWISLISFTSFGTHIFQILIWILSFLSDPDLDLTFGSLFGSYLFLRFSHILIWIQYYSYSRNLTF